MKTRRRIRPFHVMVVCTVCLCYAFVSYHLCSTRHVDMIVDTFPFLCAGLLFKVPASVQRAFLDGGRLYRADT